MNTTSTGPASTSPAGAASTPAPAGPTTTAYVSTTSPLVLTPATTIVVPLPEDEPKQTDAEWWASQPGHQSGLRAALLACIRSYEQGAGGYATDTGNGLYGAYQFDLATWRNVGGAGNPAHASPEEQDARAWALYLARGLTPWPTPARRCS